MNLSCKNCNHPFKGNYCNHCGQAANTNRLDYYSIWEDIRYGLFHFNSKIVFTAKQLFTRPGHAIRDYIEGKRLDYFKPISFVVVVASVYALVNHVFHLHIITDTAGENTILNKLGLDEVNEWLLTHFTWIAVLLVPIYALASYVVFKKQGYNFVEHLVIASFLTAQRFLLNILLFPVFYLCYETHYAEIYKWGSVVVGFALMVWVYTQFFNRLSKWRVLLLLLLSYALIITLLVIILAALLLAAEKSVQVTT